MRKGLHSKVGALVAMGVASAMVLAGCAASAPDPAATGGAGEAGEAIRVVASTNVYGDIAETIGGDRVAVTSIITSATQDPHSYEATARDRLAVEQADLVIENGGGYDAFLTDLREGSSAAVVTAVEFNHDFPGAEGHDDHAEETGHADEADHDHAEDDHAHEGEAGHDHADDHAHDDAEADDEHGHHGHNHIEGFNEHVWFDPHTMIHVVEAIADELAALDPAGADDFAASAAALVTELEGFEHELEELAAAHAGTGVFLTEPIAGYLAAGAGLEDRAPAGFASAVEEGVDVAPAVLLEALTVIGSGEVVAVLSNAQTGGAETDRVEQEAAQKGVPVVAFTEILPEGTTYPQWLAQGIADLAAVLAG